MNEKQNPPPQGDHSPPQPQARYSPPAASYPPGTGDSDQDWFDRFYRPAYESRGWLRLLSVALIVSGIFQLLTIVGILWAWICIWLGVLFWQAAGCAENARERGDRFEFERYLQRTKTIITVSGVLVIISIIMSLAGVLIMLLFGGLGIFSEMMQNF